jgi:hypothetical protein
MGTVIMLYIEIWIVLRAQVDDLDKQASRATIKYVY